MSDESEQDYASLPLDQRLIHKLWKARQSAYHEYSNNFQKSVSESDQCFQTILLDANIARGMVADSNMVAQEAGIKALVDFLQYGGPNAALRTRSAVIKPLIEKGVCASRAGAKSAAVNALLWYIEHDAADPVVDEIYPFLTHKMPKMVVASTAALTEIFKNFGTKIVAPKPAIQQLPRLFAHTDKNVRAEATRLTVELYRWLGDSFTSILFTELKPVQQKELETLFYPIKSQPPPEQLRLLHSQKEALQRKEENGIETHSPQKVTTDEDEDEEMDFADAVDVTKKIPGNLYEQLNSKLWKERKAILEELVPILNTPKIENADFAELIRALAKCMKDANIMVVTLAANCITSLAKGLKRNFSRYTEIVLNPLLERTKERKQTVLDALHGALDASYKSSSLSDIIPATVEQFSHKTPQVKTESAKFLMRCLKTSKIAPKPAEAQLIGDAAIKLTGDTQEAGRNAGLETLGILMKIIGERPMNSLMEKLDDIKKNKVKEFYSKAEVKASAPASSATANRTAPAPSTRTPSRPSAKTPLKNQVPARTPIRNAAGGAGLKRRMISPAKPPSSHAQANGQSIALARDPSLKLSNNGLANRSLARPSVAGALGGGMSSRAVDSKMLAELEQLRSEKEAWISERQSILANSHQSDTEKSALEKIINELEVTNAELREQNTQDMLSLKSKETQLIRTQSDLESAKSRIVRLEMELEKLNARYSAANALNGGTEDSSTATATQGLRRLTLTRSGERTSITSPPITAHSPRLSLNKAQFDNLLMSGRRNVMGSTNRTSDIPARPASLFNALSDYPEKENAFESAKPDVDMVEEDSAIPSRHAENWKRAANITADLRSRIESMKKHAT